MTPATNRDGGPNLTCAAPWRPDGRLLIIGEAMIELRSVCLGSQTIVGYGGDTINTAVYAAREGRQHGFRVQFLSALGDDPMSESMIAAWRDEGIDTDAVERIPGKLPGIYSISTNRCGERQFYYWREASAVRQLFRAGTADDILAQIRCCDYLYLTGITLSVLPERARHSLLSAVRGLRNSGIKLVFDSNYRPSLWKSASEARGSIRAMLAEAHIALLSAGDERQLWDDDGPESTLDRVQTLGVAEIVIKDGSGPCWLEYGGRRRRFPVITGPLPVDTTAAGDAFNGAYIVARATGDSPEIATRRGLVVSAEVIGHSGAIVPRSLFVGSRSVVTDAPDFDGMSR